MEKTMLQFSLPSETNASVDPATSVLVGLGEGNTQVLSARNNVSHIAQHMNSANLHREIPICAIYPTIVESPASDETITAALFPPELRG